MKIHLHIDEKDIIPDLIAVLRHLIMWIKGVLIVLGLLHIHYLSSTNYHTTLAVCDRVDVHEGRYCEECTGLIASREEHQPDEDFIENDEEMELSD